MTNYLEDRPVAVTDANGVTVTSAFDDLGRLRTRTYPDTGVERFGYTIKGLVAYTNQISKVTLFDYDAALRKTAETNANLEVVRYQYKPSGDLWKLTDGKSQVTTWLYDLYGRVTNKVDQASVEILRYAYDANSRLTNRWSKAKLDTKYQYDAVGNLWSVDYPSSPDITLQYDALNRLTNMVDAVGPTKYTYYPGGLLWTEDGPWADGTVTNYYNAARMRSGLGLRQPGGTFWANGFTYDAAHRLFTVTSPAGTFTYTYHAGLGGTLSAASLIKKLTLPTSPGAAYLTNTFDTVGRLLSTQLRNSSHSILNSHAYLYNRAGQRTNQTRFDASTVTYTYDNIGQLQSALGSGGQSTENLGYTYDTAWNLTQRTSGGTPVGYGIDNLNQVTNGPVGANGYDLNGNLTWQTYGAGGAPTPLVTGVPSLGQLRHDWSGWVGFQFVVGGSPMTVTELGRWVVSGNSSNHVVKLFYSDGTPIPNAAVTVSTAGKPAGQFTYATLGSPVTLAAGTTYAVMSQEVNGGDQWYDFSGTFITLSGGASGAWAVWAYPTPPPYYGATGGSGQSYGPVNLKYGAGGAKTYLYTYDDQNQLTSVATDTDATPAANRWKTDFTYDGRGRLRVKKDYTWGSGGTSTPLVSSTSQGTLRQDWNGWVGFQFVVGSSPLTVTELGRWVVSGNSGNHEVKLFYSDGTPIPNAAVTVSTAGKPAGQFAYATLASPVTLTAGTTYAVMSREYSGGDWWHDYVGTQITLTAAASGAWSVWAYPTPPPYYGDVSGAGKSHGPVGLKYLTSGSWTLASETRCLYDGLRVIQERDGANVPTVAYTRGSDLSGSLEGAGGIGGLLARSHGYSGGAFSAHSFYHADGNGNVTYLISSAQAGVAEYRYDPYGNLRYTYDSLPSGGNRYRFSSKEQMPNSGLYYYGYRFYDPNLQRWLNRDPLGKDGGVNLFSFVGNDSANNIDRLGLFGSDVHDRYWELDSGWTDSYWPWSCHLHFPRDLGKIEDKLRKDIANCNRKKFLSHMHSGQDWFGHPHGRFWPIGHAPETLCGKCPDKYPDAGALVDMDEWKQHWEAQWMENCGELPQPRHPRPE